MEEYFFSLIKSIYKNLTANMIHNGDAFSPVWENKGRMSALTTVIQHSAGSSSPCSKARKRNVMQFVWKK